VTHPCRYRQPGEEAQRAEEVFEFAPKHGCAAGRGRSLPVPGGSPAAVLAVAAGSAAAAGVGGRLPRVRRLFVWTWS
jgi:hypothetical protein